VTKALHPWEVDFKKAVQIQQELKGLLCCEEGLYPSPIRTIAGVDISYALKSDLLFAAICVFSYPDLKRLEVVHGCEKVSFPYVPGLLSFREGPVIVSAYEKLAVKPDVVIFDGQGIAHPRGLGLASHMGIVLDVPTIGCAKSALVGTWEEPPEKAGTFSPLVYEGAVVGDVVRTKDRVRPVFVSPGHKLGRRAAREIVLTCLRGYRLPEPTRQAHIEVNKVRRKKGV